MGRVILILLPLAWFAGCGESGEGRSTRRVPVTQPASRASYADPDAATLPPKRIATH
jgi:hypothetical protein